jgi:DNA repair exonuclease SbcCD ATPase subunit
MIKFKQLYLKNTRLYENIHIPLNEQGLVSITGNNGSGKSFIWGVLESVFWGSSPTGESWETFADAAKPVTEIHLDFSKEEDSYELVISRRNDKWKARFFKNGEDITPHSQVDAKRELKTLLGLNRQEFQGSVHLTQGNQHVLIEGKPAERKQYISEFFGLDTSYDVIWQNSKKELQKVRQEIQKLESDLAKTSVLYGEINKFKAQIGNIEELKSHVEEKKFILDELNSDIFKVESFSKQAEIKESLICSLARYENAEEYLRLKKEELAQYKNYEQNFVKILAHNKRAQENNSKIDELSLKIKNIEDAVKNKNLLAEKHPETFFDKILVLKNLKKDFDSNQLILSEISKYPDAKEININELNEKKDAAVKLHSDLAVLSDKLDALKSGSCPTCGKKTAAKLLEDLKKKFDETTETLKNLKVDILNLEKIKEINDNVSNLKKNIKQNICWKTEDAAELYDLEIAQKYISEYQTIKSLLTNIVKIEEIPEPEKIDTSKIKSFECEINFIEESLVRLNSIKSEISKSSKDYLEIFEKLKIQRSTIQKEYENCLYFLNNSCAAESNVLRLQSEISSYGDIVEKISKIKKQENILCAIEQAYGNQGLRLLRLRRVMKFVMSRLPFYTSRLFSEKGLSFEANCESSSVEIVARRNVFDTNGDILQTITHDISALSGGEKKRLSVALVLALADCVPNKKKSNILILDEIDANLDREGQHLFGTELLPSLKDRYESVFVISHSEGLQQSAYYDQFWKIQKNNHSSAIVKESLNN